MKSKVSTLFLAAKIQTLESIITKLRTDHPNLYIISDKEYEAQCDKNYDSLVEEGFED